MWTSRVVRWELLFEFGILAWRCKSIPNQVEHTRCLRECMVPGEARHCTRSGLQCLYDKTILLCCPDAQNGRLGADTMGKQSLRSRRSGSRS